MIIVDSIVNLEDHKETEKKQCFSFSFILPHTTHNTAKYYVQINVPQSPLTSRKPEIPIPQHTKMMIVLSFLIYLVREFMASY